MQTFHNSLTTLSWFLTVESFLYCHLCRIRYNYPNDALPQSVGINQKKRRSVSYFYLSHTMHFLNRHFCQNFQKNFSSRTASAKAKLTNDLESSMETVKCLFVESLNLNNQNIVFNSDALLVWVPIILAKSFKLLSKLEDMIFSSVFQSYKKTHGKNSNARWYSFQWFLLHCNWCLQCINAL